jgi:hypothetical protein
LFPIQYDSDQVGQELLKEQGQQIKNAISTFLQEKIVFNKDNLRWRNRKRQ